MSYIRRKCSLNERERQLTFALLIRTFTIARTWLEVAHKSPFARKRRYYVTILLERSAFLAGMRI